MTSATRYELETKDAPLFNAIKMKISNYGRWLEEDVKNNNVVYAALPLMIILDGLSLFAGVSLFAAGVDPSSFSEIVSVAIADDG